MTAAARLAPVTLRGTYVVLEPLQLPHVDELLPPASERDIWRFMGLEGHTRDLLTTWVAGRIADRTAGTGLPFLQRDARTGQAFGSTSLFDYVGPHRRAEIGHTWIGASHRGTKANPEAKLLLLAHAFDTLGLARVQLKTDPENARSRRAIGKIGGVEEGTLRNYMTYSDGTVHGRVFFSILPAEWPSVRRRLQRLIDGAPEPR